LRRKLELKSKELEGKCYFGSEELLSEELTQVTVWVLDYHDLEFAITQLEKRDILWILKPKRSKNWNKNVWRYALFRKKVESVLPPLKKNLDNSNGLT